MIKLAAFDLDGTIADTIPLCIEAFGEAVSPYAGHTLSREEIVQTFGLNEVGMVKAVVRDRWEEALADFYRIYEARHAQCEKPFEGIIPLIRGLKARGVTVAMITGKAEESCHITLKRLGLGGLFADVKTGSEFKNCKKDSLLFLMDKYGLSPEECVYVGDAVSDVTAAGGAGVRCLSAAWSSSAEVERLREVNPGRVYESIPEFAQALEAL